MAQMSRTEWSTPDDPHLDYVLTPYAPAAPAAWEGPDRALRSVNLLYETFALAGVEREGSELVDRIREGLGPFRTVWGVKNTPDQPIRSWELYFYDRERIRPDLSVDSVANLLAPQLQVDGREPWPMPWHMFSIEFDAEQLRGERRPAGVEVYVGSHNYCLGGPELELKNYYSFHEPGPGVQRLLERLRHAPRYSHPAVNSGQLIPPELHACHHICVSYKRHNDALYFSRIDTPQLLFFLRRQQWPTEIVDYVDRRRDGLGHLRWDVGFDFVGARDDGLQSVKSGFYGTF